MLFRFGRRMFGLPAGELAREAREASRMGSGAGNPVEVQVTGDVSVTSTQVYGKVVGVAVTPPSGRPVARQIASQWRAWTRGRQTA